MKTGPRISTRVGYVAAFIGVLLCGAPALVAAEMKIGYVSPGQVTDQAPQAEAARQKLEQEFEARNEELVLMREDLRGLEDRMQRDGAVMSDEEQQRIRRDIVSMRRDLQREQDAFREDLNLRRNEELTDLQRRIIRTIGEYAEEEGYDLIVSDGVLYASDPLDITERIVERLHDEFRNQQ